MSAQTAMSIMTVAEFVLWAVLTLLFWTKKMHRRFPAMGAYLALRVASAPVLAVLFYGQERHWFNDYCFAAYFFVYWSVYIASAVLLYFVCMEVFRSALSGFSGLTRFGVVVFRWAILASVIVSFSTVSFSHHGIAIIPDLAYGLMRSVSILELSLLAFLCLTMNALRLSARDVTFGIALGFGLMSSSDFILASFWSVNTSLTDPLQFVYEAVILGAIGTWVVSCALPVPARQPVLIPVNSVVYRWNEIASALGHSGTQVALQQPATSFFLTDVEKVVDKVLNRTLKGSESES
jgi:hypothetical protein